MANGNPTNPGKANSGLIAFFQNLFISSDRREPGVLSKNETNASTALGSPRWNDFVPNLGQTIQALELFGIDGSYTKTVEDCTKLSETNLVFKAIIDKLAKTVAQPMSRIEVSSLRISNRKARQITDIFNRLRDRIDWENNKDMLIRRLLNEGGLSWEMVILAGERNQVRALEYRPHHTIRPLVDEFGHFINIDKAYRQLGLSGREIATFARWQIIDYNLVDSAYHNRGVPHLVAARNTLSSLELMIRGLVQKWIRQGGSIEHFNLEDSTRWADLENFKKLNNDSLQAAPDSLVRQFFTKGKATIERIAGDQSGRADSETMDFLLELIFMAAGVPKAALGFRSNTLIKDMADIAWQNFNQTLDFIERRLFMGLDTVFQFELLLNDIIADDIDYRIIGGEFEPVSKLSYSKETWEAGALSINEIRRAAGAEPDPDPLFDIPGLAINAEIAQQVAVDRDVAPAWMKDEVERVRQSKKDMATLAAAAAVSAAENNGTSTQVASGQRPESQANGAGTKPAPTAPKIPKQPPPPKN